MQTFAPMNITFRGAVRTVTGSMHLVEAGGTRILLDCGLFQGHRADFYEVNAHFPFPPSGIDAVVLSHAHLDHCGNLPTLVRQGFRGSIYCTPGTHDLTGLILRDSAKVQQQDIAHVNKVHAARGMPEMSPLYSLKEAEQAIARLVAVPYHHRFTIGQMAITYYDAGHILGSAVTVVEAEGKTLAFTGDLGRPNAPILRDPELSPPVDVLLMESTYGDRRHDSFDAGEAALIQIISDTARRGGKVLIPAFAVGRTQDIAYALHRAREAGRIPSVPAFVDSPMAVEATEIFRLHPECFDDDIRNHLERHDPFGFKQLRYLRSVEESKQLNAMTEPFVVIATSGMAESGRILHHLKHNLGDSRSSLVFVSFQAEHTLGRRLADGVRRVNILGEPYDVRLQVHKLESFSSHADSEELLGWARRIPRVGKIYCVHGEERQSLALAGRLAALGFAAEVPQRGQEVTI